MQIGHTKNVISFVKEKSKTMISNPSIHSWTHFPFLPVKRGESGKDMDYGVIWAAGSQLIIYECNIFMMPKVLKDFKKLARWKYESFDEMIEDGWIVD